MMTKISLCFSDKTALYVITGKSVQPAIRHTQLFATKRECDGLTESFGGLSFGYCWYYYPDLYYICHIRYYGINNVIHCALLCKWHVGRYL
jgi:predicted signal transduction protein with EAL and GGDEF domain